MNQNELFPDIYSKKSLVEALLAMERNEPTRRIRQPYDVYPVVLQWADCEQEHFIVVTLNGAHEVIEANVVSVGLVNRTLVHPREVFRTAIRQNAAAVIVAHNHPSGNHQPSHEDRNVTSSLVEAGEIVGIRVLDHVVFSSSGYYSFLEHGEV